MRSPSSLLLHPLQLFMLGLLVLNDHYFKHYHPGVLSGKLSDVAFMVACPIWLYVALTTVLGWAFQVQSRHKELLLLCIMGTGIFFSSMQLTQVGDELYKTTLGFLQWPFRGLGSMLLGEPWPDMVPVAATPDPSDLACLPLLYLPWHMAREGTA